MNEDLELRISWNNLIPSLEYIVKEYIETGEKLRVIVNLNYQDSKIHQPFTIECKIVEKEFKVE